MEGRLTLQDIIKRLPFDEKFKVELLTKLDTLTPAQHSAIVDILWVAYDTYNELMYQENIEKALLNSAEGKEVIDKNFYDKIRQNTETELAKETAKTSSSFDISATRTALQDIMKKIK